MQHAACVRACVCVCVCVCKWGPQNGTLRYMHACMHACSEPRNGALTFNRIRTRCWPTAAGGAHSHWIGASDRYLIPGLGLALGLGLRFGLGRLSTR